MPPSDALKLLPVPEPLAAMASPIRRSVLAQTHAPAEAWGLLRRRLRSAPNPLLRLAAQVDDAYRTTEPEYLDLESFPAEERQRLLVALDRFHRRLGTYERLCRLIVPVVARTGPRVLELASGHGQLAIALSRSLEAHGVDATVEGSDLAPELVALAQENARAAKSHATFRVLDATRIDAPDDAYDVAVNALAMHHFPFELMVEVMRELRRVARRAIIVDLFRSPLLYLPGGLLVGALSQSLGCVHDGLISLRKAWGTEEWRLAIELAGWERSQLGMSLPYLVVQLERGD